MNNDPDQTNSNQKYREVIKLLSEFLGVEEDDIHMDDSLREDLHMSPSDITDFVQILNDHGFDVELTDLTIIETLDELLDKIIQEEI
jgi:acyl carrier protein